MKYYAQLYDFLATSGLTVIEIARRHSAALIYTVGGLHAPSPASPPRIFVAATTASLTRQVTRSGFEVQHGLSMIRGFNGIILGYAKAAKIRGIGLYGELANPNVPQYVVAKNIITTLEKLTYRKFGDTSILDAMADGQL